MAAIRPVALVTGASSGIGKVAAHALVDAGFDVVGTSRNAGVNTQRDGVTFLDLDVTSDDSVANVVERVMRQYGRLNVVVNNAGVGASGAAEENSVAQVRNLFDINVFGVIRVTKAVLPLMRAQVVAEAVNEGDDPTLVAKAIVAAATSRTPRLRYPASPRARRLSALRRIAPARTFDGQLRKFNKLAG
jgi:NAD(P)-dependent dehydrogenase (short-subunit alcohol dehydrogenase family)